MSYMSFCGFLGTGHNRSNHLPGCDVCDTMEIAFGVIRFGVCVLVGKCWKGSDMFGKTRREAGGSTRNLISIPVLSFQNC